MAAERANLAGRSTAHSHTFLFTCTSQASAAHGFPRWPEKTLKNISASTFMYASFPARSNENADIRCVDNAAAEPKAILRRIRWLMRGI